MLQSGSEFVIAVLPWIWLLLGILVCAAGTLSVPLRVRAREVAIAASLLAAVSAFAELYRGRSIGTGVFVTAGGGSHLAQGSLIIDFFTMTIVITTGLLAVASLLCSERWVQSLADRSGLAYALVLSAEAFADLAAAQHEMVALVVATGGLIFSTCALLACFKTDHFTIEAAAKLLLAGTLLTIVMSAGLAILYGATGSTTQAPTGDTLTLALGGALVVVALAGLCGALPLPQPLVTVGLAVPAWVAGWVLTASVLGVMAGLIRLGADDLGRNVHGWAGAMGTLGALTLVYAGVRAWREETVRGLASYLTVAQTGALLVALMSFGNGTDGLSADGVNICVAATLAAGLTITATYSVISVLERAGLRGRLHDHRSLLHRNGLVGVLLSICALSLAGAPPTFGFIFRGLSLTSSAYINRFGVGVLAVTGMAICVLAALRVPATVATAPSHDTHHLHFRSGIEARSAMIVSVAAVLLLAVFAGPLMQLGSSAAKAIFAS